MKKRLFILTNSKIPFGNANSNYIRMFAKAVLYAGWKVIVLGCGDNRDIDKQIDGRYVFENIEYNNIAFNEHLLPFSISGHLAYGNAMVKHMKQYAVNDDDYIYIYSAYWNLFDQVKKEYSALHKIGHLVADCVEWFQPWQYKFGVANPEYQLWKFNFQHCITKYKKVIPISKNLQQFFENHGCKTIIVPPMIDADGVQGEIQSKDYDVLNFMYSGAATNKDSIDVMLESLALLPRKDRERIKLHFTSLSQDTLKKLLGKKNHIFDAVKESLIFHGWLGYTDLLDLYKGIDFLVIFREKNVVTISNFPSKVPEMMNYGIIPICSDVGDYTSIYLTDKVDSIFVKKCTAEEGATVFSFAIHLSRKEIDEMKHNAKKCAQEKFDYRLWANTITTFLDKELE